MGIFSLISQRFDKIKCNCQCVCQLVYLFRVKQISRIFCRGSKLFLKVFIVRKFQNFFWIQDFQEIVLKFREEFKAGIFDFKIEGLNRHETLISILFQIFLWILLKSTQISHESFSEVKVAHTFFYSIVPFKSWFHFIFFRIFSPWLISKIDSK